MATNFSVVMPAYNAAWCIEDALKSIMAQSQPAQQVIVVDDGSSDTTADLVRSRFPQVEVIRVENGGAAVARKVGIDHCQTEWVALCDSDDVWNPDHLERKAELIATFPDAHMVFSDCVSFGELAEPGHSLFSEAPPGWLERHGCDFRGDYFRMRDPYRAMLEFFAPFPSGMAFRIDAYRQSGGFLAKYSRWIGEDSEFTRRFLALPGCVAAGDRRQTWAYRRHGGNFSRVRWKNYYCKPRILKEHLDLGFVPEGVRGEVEAEIVRSLGEAFDVAYWDACYNDARHIFKELPPEIRTFRRRLRAMAARLRIGS